MLLLNTGRNRTTHHRGRAAAAGRAPSAKPWSPCSRKPLKWRQHVPASRRISGNRMSALPADSVILRWCREVEQSSATSGVSQLNGWYGSLVIPPASSRLFSFTIARRCVAISWLPCAAWHCCACFQSALKPIAPAFGTITRLCSCVSSHHRPLQSLPGSSSFSPTATFTGCPSTMCRCRSRRISRPPFPSTLHTLPSTPSTSPCIARASCLSSSAFASKYFARRRRQPRAR